MISLDLIAQAGITVFGVSAIILVARKNKWGFVLGLASEPFWLITSYMNKQWGVMILCVIYVFSWSYGAYKWFKKDN